MPNEFVARNGVIALNTSQITGSLLVTGGNVGIGTASPATQLGIFLPNTTGGGVSLQAIAGTTYARFGLINPGTDNNSYIGSTTNNDFLIYTNNTEKVRILSGGNVGIGTTSPSSLLHVRGAAAGDASNVRIASTGTYGGITIYEDTTARLYLAYGDSGNIFSNGQADSANIRGSNYLQLGASSTATITINGSNDFVGIGNTAPAQKLDVSGSVNVRSSSPTILLDRNGSYFWRLINGDGGTYPISTFNIANNGGTAIATFLDGGNVGIGTTAPSVKLQVQAIYGGVGGSNNMDFYTNSIFRVRIDSNGNVGIGTTSPLSKLHVRTTTNQNFRISAGSNLEVASINDADSAYSSLTFRASNFDFQNGNVGIGTTSPVATLHVGPSPAYFIASAQTFQVGYNNFPVVSSGLKPVASISGYPELSYQNSYSASILDVITGWENSATHPILRVSAYNTMYSAPAFVVRANGNVGIGTITPTQKLHVVGSAAIVTGDLLLTQGYGITWNNGDNYIKGISGYHLQFTTYDGSASQVEVMRLTGGSSGGARVGIGTTIPSAKLHVSASTDVVFEVDGASASTLLFVTASGNVGINTTTPTLARLQVNGNVWATSYTGSFSGSITAPGSSNNVIYNSSGVLAGSNSFVFTGTSVGIGTTSPQRRLSVSGSIILSGPSAAQEFIIGDENVRYFSLQTPSGASNLQFNVYGGSNIMTLLSDGNVGIGTTSSTRRLTVWQTTDGQYSQYIYHGGTNGSSYGLLIDAGATSVDAGLRVRSKAGTDYLIVKGDGNVGIGTTSPNEKFHVAGNIHAYAAGGIDAGLFASTAAGSTTIAIRSNGITHFNGGNVGIGTTSPSSKLQIGNGTSNTPSAVAVLSADGGNTVLNALSLVNSRTAANGNGTSINFHNANNYGPTGRIASIQDSGTNASLRFSVYNSTDDALVERITLLSSGSVGIGTSSPSSKLFINTGGTGSVANGIGMDNGAQQHFWYLENNTTSVYSIGSTAGQWKWSNSNGTHVTILAGGSVGIGTTAPETKLHIASGDVLISNGQYYSVESLTGGNYKIAGLTSGNIIQIGAIDYTSAGTIFAGGDNISITTGGAAGTSRMYINNGGNVGIGTTSPEFKFDVEGNVKIFSALVQRSGTNLGASEITSANQYRNHNGPVLTNGSPSSITSYGTFRGYQAVYGTSSFYPDYQVITQGAYANPLFEFYSGNGGSHAGSLPTNTAIRDGYLYQFVKGPSFSGTGGGAPVTSSNSTLIWGITSANNAYFASNVGIGITSPSYKLHINGGSGTRADVQVTYDALGTTATDGAQFGIQSAGAYIWNFENSAIYFGTNNTRVVDISSAGNVGIGITSPSARLHVSGAAGNAINVNRTGGYASIYGTNDLVFETDSTFYFGAYTARTFLVNSVNGASGTFTITSAGNVGIGTSSVGALLAVNGNAFFASKVTIKGSAAGTLGNSSGLELYQDSATDTSYLYNYYSGPLLLGTNNTERVRITAGGNVGIGTTAPAQRLHVSGSIRASNDMIVDGPDSSRGYYLYYNSSAWPNYSSWLLQTGASDTAGTRGLIINANTGQSVSNYGIGFAIDSSNKMFIQYTGNVGIGTTSPFTKLHVYASGGGLELSPGATTNLEFIDRNNTGGTVNTSFYTRYGDFSFFKGDYSSASLVIKSSGNVGIGSASPAYALDVNGTGRFTAIIETSTRTLKDNIESYSTDIDKFKQLEPVSFIWKETGKQDVGLIAEDVEQIFPEFVSKTDEGEITGINYGKLSTIFINVLKQQQQKIELLEEQIKKLTS